MPDPAYVTYELLRPVPEFRGQRGDVIVVEFVEESQETEVSLLYDLDPQAIRLVQTLLEEGALRLLPSSARPPEVLSRPRLELVR